MIFRHAGEEQFLQIVKEETAACPKRQTWERLWRSLRISGMIGLYWKSRIENLINLCVPGKGSYNGS